MDAPAILDEIQGAGLVISVIEGDKLKVEPRENLTDGLKTLIRENKAALLALLSAGTVADDADRNQGARIGQGSTAETPPAAEQVEPAQHSGEVPADQAGALPKLPAWCWADCPSLERIPGAGAGCARRLPDGGQAWRALVSMPGCPAARARAYPCGGCSGKTYRQVAGGWQCEGCGAVFPWIGGGKGPVIIKEGMGQQPGLGAAPDPDQAAYRRWMLAEADALERAALAETDPEKRAARLAVVVAVREECGTPDERTTQEGGHGKQG